MAIDWKQWKYCIEHSDTCLKVADKPARSKK